MRVERVIAVGLAAGLLSGMFGVGGGILIVPGLMWVASMEQRRAHGTSLAAVLPIALFGLVTYVANDHVNVGAAVALIAGSLIGTLLGTAWLARAPKRTLSLAFAAVLAVSAVRLVFEIDGSREHALTIGSAVALVVTGFVAGVLAGLLGIGGGVVMVPAMMLVLGLAPVVAKGTSLAVIVRRRSSARGATVATERRRSGGHRHRAGGCGHCRGGRRDRRPHARPRIERVVRPVAHLYGCAAGARSPQKQGLAMRQKAS